MNGQPLRRGAQQIKNREEIEQIFREAVTGHIGLTDRGTPYVVPMNFGWEFTDSGAVIYIHCAGAGRKLPLLESGETVCFETAVHGELHRAESPCDWGISYRSVIGWGKPAEIKSSAEKTKALNLIMKKYSGNEFTFAEAQLDRTRVFRIPLEELTAKRSSC